MLNFNKKDNIISIVKSLHPINYLYSKQNKDYDKYFRSSSLKGLIKQINSHPKFNEFLKPGESFEELNAKNDTYMDVNFKSTFNYIEELSNLKNLPLVLLNKNYYKKGKFNNDYEEHSKKKDKKKKLLEEKKKNKKQRISQIKNSGDAEVTLDPGRYHPNYDFIKRRYPCAYLGKPKIKEESFHKEIKIIDEEEEKKEIEQENSNSNNENDNNISNISNRINQNTKINNFDKIVSNKKDKSNSLYKSKKMNSSTPNFYSIHKTLIKNNNNKIGINDKTKMKKVNKFNDHYASSSWSNGLDLDKTKITKEQMKLSNEKNKIYYRTYFRKNNKKIINRNSSMENLRCPIIFDRMPGRDRPINFVDGGRDGCRSNYNPDYNVIRPHIPSTIFKCKRKFQNFKKYITGKIIRSYLYNPEQYFVFEIKDKKDDKISGDYGTILSKSKMNIKMD